LQQLKKKLKDKQSSKEVENIKHVHINRFSSIVIIKFSKLIIALCIQVYGLTNILKKSWSNFMVYINSEASSFYFFPFRFFFFLFILYFSYAKSVWGSFLLRITDRFCKLKIYGFLKKKIKD
jgi:hypothetical protein